MMRKTLTTDAVKMLVQAIVASRLDYCNSIFHLINAASLQALQSVFNAAAHLVMRKRKYDHITATLCNDLHWLPIWHCISYKQCTMDHGVQVPAVAALVYLAEMCVPVAASTGCQCLRLASHGYLTVLRTRTSKYEPRSVRPFGTVYRRLFASRQHRQFQKQLQTFLSCDLLCVEWDVKPYTLTHSLLGLQNVTVCMLL